MSAFGPFRQWLAAASRFQRVRPHLAPPKAILIIDDGALPSPHWSHRWHWGPHVSDLTDVTRKLVAVFAADVEGYSRLMGADEVGTLKGLTERRAILDRMIGEQRGRIANTAGAFGERPTLPYPAQSSAQARKVSRWLHCSWDG